MFFSINFRFFDIPMSVLPDVRSSSEIYGKLVSVGSFLPVVLCALSKSIIIRTHKTREFKIKHELKKHLTQKVYLDNPLMNTYFHALYLQANVWIIGQENNGHFLENLHCLCKCVKLHLMLFLLVCRRKDPSVECQYQGYDVKCIT